MSYRLVMDFTRSDLSRVNNPGHFNVSVSRSCKNGFVDDTLPNLLNVMVAST
jgi:hypothetical protein